MVDKVFVHKLADVIEEQPETSLSAQSGFNMIDFMHPCGTPACVAGWAIALGENINDVNQALKNIGYSKTYSGLAAQHMDIDADIAEELFICYEYSDKKRIVKTLRHLADTGELKWFEWENAHE